jgi:16S rRNA C1402 (ribose-2'-O) methylase RsmI
LAIGRELTKAHEELVVRPISRHLEALVEGRGEYTLVVAPASPVVVSPEPPTDAAMLAEFCQLTDIEALPRRSAIKQLAVKYGMSARAVYTQVEHARDSG